jgi:hypothetical protein
MISLLDDGRWFCDAADATCVAAAAVTAHHLVGTV